VGVASTVGRSVAIDVGCSITGSVTATGGVAQATNPHSTKREMNVKRILFTRLLLSSQIKFGKTGMFH
jgi:hypothetical protein